MSDSNRNQINVAICGPVSAGKSTLLNSLFVASYSDMKIKRTTMTPQVYYETKKQIKKVSKEIKEKNREINEKLSKKKGSELTISDIEETAYEVPPVRGLVGLKSEVYLTVYDIPGLNDAQTKEVYFQYMDNNFYKFDVILFVVDINSALNTSDEIFILERILQNSKKNLEEYGIHNKLVVVANKCDDLRFNDEENTYELLDEEQTEMFEQVHSMVKERVEVLFPEMEYTIVPLSSEDSYIYRMYNENPSYELDMKHLNKFGCNEYGKSRWNRLSEAKKKEMIRKLMSKMDIKETLKHTGFMGFSNALNGYLDYEHQYMYLMNHIVYGLKGIKNFNNLDITEDITHFYQYFQRINEINEQYERHLGKEVCSFKQFHNHLNKYMEQYLNVIVQQYINVDNQSVRSEGNLPQVEQIKKQFDSFSANFNKSSTEIEYIKELVNKSLNNFYVDSIKSKTKVVGTVIDYAFKLAKNAYKVTKELILDIFTNKDMKNKTAEEVLKYLETLCSKKMLSFDEKKEILKDFIKTIYTEVSMGRQVKAITENMYACYFYHADLYWSRLMLYDIRANETYLELAFLAKKNMISSINAQNQEFKNVPEEVLILEMYLDSLYQQVHPKERTHMPKVERGKHRSGKVKHPNYDDGNLSEELDLELGLVRV